MVEERANAKNVDYQNNNYLLMLTSNIGEGTMIQSDNTNSPPQIQQQALLYIYFVLCCICGDKNCNFFNESMEFLPPPLFSLLLKSSLPTKIQK